MKLSLQSPRVINLFKKILLSRACEGKIFVICLYKNILAPSLLEIHSNMRPKQKKTNMCFQGAKQQTRYGTDKRFKQVE